MRHRTNPHAKTAAAIMRDVEANVRAFDRLQSATDRIDPRSALELLRDCADRAMHARRLIEGRAR